MRLSKKVSGYGNCRDLENQNGHGKHIERETKKSKIEVMEFCYNGSHYVRFMPFFIGIGLESLHFPTVFANC